MDRSEYLANEQLAAARKPAAWHAPAPVRANRKPAKRGFFARLLGV